MKNDRKILGTIVFFFALSFMGIAQGDNPNLIAAEKGATFEASSTFPVPPWMAPPSNIAHEKLQVRGEANEIEGAWISIKWDEPQKIKELWIVNKAVPFDFKLDPYMRTSNYLVPRKIKLIFAEGASVDAELRLCEYYQILTLAEEIVTSSLKIEIETVWDGSGEKNTGLCKVKAFTEANAADFKVDIFEMYDIQNDKPVQSAKIEILNPGGTINDARLLIMKDGKNFGTLARYSIAFLSS